MIKIFFEILYKMGRLYDKYIGDRLHYLSDKMEEYTYEKDNIFFEWLSDVVEDIVCCFPALVLSAILLWLTVLSDFGGFFFSGLLGIAGIYVGYTDWKDEMCSNLSISKNS